MEEWIHRIPPVDWALLTAYLFAVLCALLTFHRGGRFRGLIGWAGFWLFFGGMLVCLSRTRVWISFPLIAVLMFAGLREYFSVAPVRPQDRHAILAAYLAIPFALYPGFVGSAETFSATVPIVLFLLFPMLLSVGVAQKGLLDSMGRILLGILLFVFCAGHLGLILQLEGPGLPELFGIFVIAAELPQRLIGRYGRNARWLRASIGVAVSALAASALGFWLGPWCGLVEEDAARAALLVVLGVTTGALVTEAVVRDLAAGSTASRIGRVAFLDRSIPALYAAPVFFHYLNYFA